MARQQFPFFEVVQGKRRFCLTTLPASVVTNISYAAVRNLSDEEGAIQRLLNVSRISRIKKFTLEAGAYPNAIILNWVSKSNRLNRSGKDNEAPVLSFFDNERSAQIIDGQHRVAGIKAAIAEDHRIGDLQLPVVIYEGLTTSECAAIFLAINTEQKPVPPSLVYDLFGVTENYMSVDSAALRARDIALYLNETEGSPYYSCIKLPGVTMRHGVLLSTAVASIKPLVETAGILEQVGVDSLEMQRRVVMNLFLALQSKYGETWRDTKNVFMKSAGFSAAMEFLRYKLVNYCQLQSSFEVSTIAGVLQLDESSLILTDIVKGASGSEAVRQILDVLNSAFRPPIVNAKTIRV